MYGERRSKWYQRVLLRALQRRSGRFSRRLGLLENVHAVGIGQKRRNGAPANVIAVVAFVNKKRHVESSERVPRALPMILWGRRTRISTDVRELATKGKFCALESGSKLYSGGGGLPLLPGTCSLVVGAPSALHLVTCAHLFYDPSDPNHAGPCVTVNPQNGKVSRIGDVIVWTQISASALNQGDAALVRLAAGVNARPRTIVGTPVPVSVLSKFDPRRNDYFYVVDGVQYPCNSPVWRSGSDPIDVIHLGRSHTFGNFWLLSMSSGSRQVRGGHSGALIVRQGASGLEAAGILFGTINGSEALAFDANFMFSRLGVG
jgi:hypothetical protein